jgi:hypothetical protein
MFILVQRHVNLQPFSGLDRKRQFKLVQQKNLQGFTLFHALLVATNKYPVEDLNFLGCYTIVWYFPAFQSNLMWSWMTRPRRSRYYISSSTHPMTKHRVPTLLWGPHILHEARLPPHGHNHHHLLNKYRVSRLEVYKNTCLCFSN